VICSPHWVVNGVWEESDDSTGRRRLVVDAKSSRLHLISTTTLSASKNDSARPQLLWTPMLLLPDCNTTSLADSSTENLHKMGWQVQYLSVRVSLIAAIRAHPSNSSRAVGNVTFQTMLQLF